MSSNSPQNPSDSGEARTIKFHYIKSNLFRVIQADGVWGGLTPSLNMQMAFYSERSPIPQIILQEVNPNGTFGDEIDRVARDGIVREVEVNVVISVDVARALVLCQQRQLQSAS